MLDLAAVMAARELTRHHAGRGDQDPKIPRMPQLGPAAAMHLSELADPVSSWLKGGGSEELSYAEAVPPAVLDAVHERFEVEIKELPEQIDTSSYMPA